MDHSDFAPISLRVENLWVVKGGGLFTSPRAILQDVSFSVEPGTFCAVIGPNGAGKTTLLRALIGERPASGRILLSQAGAPVEDLYDNPEYWMQKIGYVPVDNILHDTLTVRQALLHVGRLRLPNLSHAEIEARIKLKLESLGFGVEDDRLNQLIGTLSSGERKKINICAELLTDPALLLLDEPTSNLDPNAERDLMDSLKHLTVLDGKGSRPTILIITHTLETLNRCDQVIFIANSRKEVDGATDQVFQHLREQTVKAGKLPPEQSEQFEQWAAIFDFHKTLDNVARRDRVAAPPRTDHKPSPPRDRSPDSFWRQFKLLTSRYHLSRFNDVSGIFVMLMIGFLAGFLMLIAPDNIFLEAQDASLARQTVVLYVILVVIIGAFISHREVSKEFRIYIQERAKGLSPLAYIAAKATWLAFFVGWLIPVMILALSGMPIARILSFASGASLVGIGLATLFTRHGAIHRLKGFQRTWRIIQVCLLGAPPIAAAFIQVQNKILPDYPLPVVTVEIYILLTLILACIGSIVLGLFVSAAVGSNNDRATQLVIGAVILNVVLAFSALLFATPAFQYLFDIIEPLTISHWGYRGFSSALGIYCWSGQYRFENFNSYGHILATWLYLILHIALMIALGVLALRMQEAWTTRTRLLNALIRKERAGLLFVFAAAVVLSWGAFLLQQSWFYFDLTYYDRLYGGTRYANIMNATDPFPMQQVIGGLSQSQCG
jgi:ABC-type multidrug transport system ATPase subunit